MSCLERRNHVAVGGIVLGGDIAAGHAVAAEMAGWTRWRSHGKRRLAHVNHAYTEFFRAALDDQIAAFHRRRRQKDAIRQIVEMVEITANSDFALDLVVIRREVRIIDGPILARAVDRSPFEIAMA